MKRTTLTKSARAQKRSTTTKSSPSLDNLLAYNIARQAAVALMAKACLLYLKNCIDGYNNGVSTSDPAFTHEVALEAIERLYEFVVFLKTDRSMTT